MPEGYDEWILCKALGCLPSELDGENADKINRFLAFYNAETMNHNALEKVRAEQVAAANAKK